MTLGSLLKEGKEKLQNAGIAEWDLDAWYLLEHVTGMNRSQYFLYMNKEVPSEQEAAYLELVGKRSCHIPLQHLTGTQEFMGLEFLVNESVLIPRQDTEVLVEEALKHVQEHMEILDVCTGSGCILLSILKLGNKICHGTLHGTGVDLSEEALKVAVKNAETLQTEAEFVHSDLFAKVDGKYDMILSNPPYIERAVVETLQEEVRDHEPRMALDGGEDGLDFYRKIVKKSPQYLKNDGWLFFEIGYDQGEAVSSLMKEEFKEVQVIKDLAGLDRVVYGRKA